MIRLAGASLLIAAALAGCTTVPDRFAPDPADPKNCGYRMEPTSIPGFALEVFYREYKFLPSPDEPVQNAKQCFIRTAERLSKEKGKSIKPILLGDINAAPARNIMDGTYTVYVTGRVQFSD